MSGNREAVKALLSVAGAEPGEALERTARKPAVKSNGTQTTEPAIEPPVRKTRKKPTHVELAEGRGASSAVPDAAPVPASYRPGESPEEITTDSGYLASGETETDSDIEGTEPTSMRPTSSDTGYLGSGETVLTSEETNNGSAKAKKA